MATSVTHGRAKSTVNPIPASFDADLDGYAAANPADGKILAAVHARRPTFHNDGLVPSDASAMTLDTDVFCESGQPTVDTYIHELVHVSRYGEVGPVRFILAPVEPRSRRRRSIGKFCERFRATPPLSLQGGRATVDRAPWA